ncbi:methionine aminopeptidase [Heyndrickxia sporothermodurans]
MGWIDSFSNWKMERYEKYLMTMQNLGKCPDCKGKGFTIPYSVYAAAYECPSCNGSGLYSDWFEVNG